MGLCRLDLYDVMLDLHELELELIQSHMKQKPMLRGEVDARAGMCPLLFLFSQARKSKILEPKVIYAPPEA